MAARPADPDPTGASLAPRAAHGPLVTRCRTDAEACRELSSEVLEARESEARCARGARDGCLLLGLAYERGVGVEQSSVRARESFERACQLEHAAACSLAAGGYASGEALTREGAELAVPFLARACEGEVVSACATLGLLYYLGEVIDGDLQNAATFYGRSCQLRSPEHCFDVASALRYMDDLQNGIRLPSPGELHTNMCWLYDASCKVGHDYSCEQLEMRCAREYPEAYDNRSAFDTASHLCQALDGLQCAKAGRLREGSPGVAPSMAEAERHYETGCREGDGESCVRQAALYMHGRRVGDPVKLLGEACGRALTGACLAEGLGYQTGELGRKDPARAMEGFVRSCAQSEPEGCLALARGRRDQLAGPVSRESVTEAFHQACAFGSLTGCREGASFEPSARAWFETQACFHGEDGVCGGQPAGLEITAKPVIGETCLARDCQLQFVGADGHGLLVSSGAERFLVDPHRAAVTESAAFWYVDQLVPHAGRAGQQRIWTAAWGWDAAAGGLAALLGIGGEGAGAKHSLAIWSARSAALQRLPLPGNSRVVSVQALSPDLRFGVVTIPGDRESAVVLDLRTRRAIGSPIEGSLTAVAFSADSGKVAIGFKDGSLAILSTATGAATRIEAAVATIGVATWSIHSLSFHPTRPWLVATDLASRVRLWQLDGAALSSRSLSPAERATLAAFSADGRYLALCDNQQLVMLDATSLQRVARPARCGSCNESSSIAVSPDSRFVAILNISSAVNVFELATPAPAGGAAR